MLKLLCIQYKRFNMEQNKKKSILQLPILIRASDYHDFDMIEDVLYRTMKWDKDILDENEKRSPKDKLPAIVGVEINSKIPYMAVIYSPLDDGKKLDMDEIYHVFFDLLERQKISNLEDLIRKKKNVKNIKMQQMIENNDITLTWEDVEDEVDVDFVPNVKDLFNKWSSNKTKTKLTDELKDMGDKSVSGKSFKI